MAKQPKARVSPDGTTLYTGHNQEENLAIIRNNAREMGLLVTEKTMPDGTNEVTVTAPPEGKSRKKLPTTNLHESPEP